ncbi:MAG: hypothetical protein ACKOI0_01205, partial [Actinomycetota bacterium]
MRLNPESIARASSRHPWRTIGVWVLLIGVMGWVSQRYLADVLTQDIAFTNRPDSVKVQEAIDRSFPQASGSADTVFFLVQGDEGAAEEPAFQASVAEVADAVRGLDGVVEGPVFTYLDLRGQARSLLLPDGAAAVAAAARSATTVASGAVSCT